MAGFRTRARAVDLLGRQQIANLPTALSELFKNAHDAYATRAEADFYRTHNMLIVGDDGVGMDRQTFEQSWLTIATESKLGRNATPKPAGMRKRIQLGEKGIGRFAIGALGGQVLVVSRRQGFPAIAALVSWKMFELPRINLEDVPVGLMELDTNVLKEADVRQLKQPLIEAAHRFYELDSSPEWTLRIQGILSELEEMPNDPYGSIVDLHAINGSGTQFLICPVSADLPPDLESPGPGKVSSLKRTLHGFTDSWIGQSSNVDFTVDFNDHRGSGDTEDLLDVDDFFVSSDFDRADHHLVGSFDREGTFSGTIRIFQEEPTAVTINRPKRLPLPRCGPFDFKLGVVQGQLSDSRLDPEAFAAITKRLEILGGVYVYKDGVRVQPYGRPDVDYLEIEERRTRGAGYYYFSYRRMFGAVSLTSQRNANLEEKAGREGFTQGRAFSDFRNLLMNLFEELAATFFRAGGSRADDYQKGRERLRREDMLRRHRERLAASGRRRMRAELANAIRLLHETDFHDRAWGIVTSLEKSLEDADRLQPASRKVAAARRELHNLLVPFQVMEPHGFALTEAMRQDFALVERSLDDINTFYILPALEAINGLSAKVEERLAALEADERERREFIDQQTNAAMNTIRDADNQGRQALSRLNAEVHDTLKDLRQQYERGMEMIVKPTGVNSTGWIRQQADFERHLDTLTADSRSNFNRVTNLVETSRLVFSTGLPTPSDLAAAADAEIVELRAKIDAQLELVQLGMALAVVDHEFQATVTSIRKDVRELAGWAKKNPPLVSLYENLRRDFDHLDSYLTLLTPLQRRVRRTKTTIKGSDIVRFLEELFRQRLRDSGVDLRSTRAFRATEIWGFASTFYPVFINLVDNSLYWIERQTPDRPRSIELSKRGNTIVYRDSGPGIADAIADRVFDFGFTTRPGGSGLGLAIASQVLERAEWSIRLGDAERGAEFLLSPRIGS